LESNHIGAVDLHIHTTASDGSLTVREIFRLARKLKLAAIAITDHDTLAGTIEALNQGIPNDLGFLTGVEISTQAPKEISLSGSLHILGYGVRLNDPDLNEILTKLRESRANRNPAIIERLGQIGIDITYAQLANSFKDAQLGRPHIAQLLVKKGYATSINEAFDRYLTCDTPGYVEKYRIDCRRAVEAVRQAGGVAVLAHPVLLNLSDAQLEALLGMLTRAGLKGIEVYFPEHSRSQTALYQSLARRYSLIETGGTDFHGAVTPDIQMGIGTGELRVPYSAYENIHTFLNTNDML